MYTARKGHPTYAQCFVNIPPMPHPHERFSTARPYIEMAHSRLYRYAGPPPRREARIVKVTQVREATYNRFLATKDGRRQYLHIDHERHIYACVLAPRPNTDARRYIQPLVDETGSRRCVRIDRSTRIVEIQLHMPYAPFTLDSLVRISSPCDLLPPHYWLGVAAQLMGALDYLHTTCGIMHRDVKPENVLITSAGEARLADFDSAYEISPPPEHTDSDVWNSHRNNTSVCTANWRAFELFTGRTPYDEAVDVWSAAATVYLALMGVPLFTGSGDKEVVTHVVRFCLPLTSAAYASYVATSVPTARLWIADITRRRGGVPPTPAQALAQRRKKLMGAAEHRWPDEARGAVKLLATMLDPHPCRRPSAAACAHAFREIVERDDPPAVSYATRVAAMGAAHNIDLVYD